MTFCGLLEVFCVYDASWTVTEEVGRQKKRQTGEITLKPADVRHGKDIFIPQCSYFSVEGDIVFFLTLLTHLELKYT